MAECIPPPPPFDPVAALQLAALDHEIRKAEHTYAWLLFVRENRSKWRRR